MTDTGATGPDATGPDATGPDATAADGVGSRRRRRRQATRPAGAPATRQRASTAEPPPTSPSTETPRPTQAPRSGSQPASARGHGGRTGGPQRTERADRELSGAGPSQVGVEGALRARDVNRPTAEDLAEAERDVKIVRRHWTPDAGH